MDSFIVAKENQMAIIASHMTVLFGGKGIILELVDNAMLTIAVKDKSLQLLNVLVEVFSKPAIELVKLEISPLSGDAISTVTQTFNSWAHFHLIGQNARTKNNSQRTPGDVKILRKSHVVPVLRKRISVSTISTINFFQTHFNAILKAFKTYYSLFYAFLSTVFNARFR
jgi:hypothetical protein